MPQPQLTVHRQDRGNRALITLAGEIDLESAPLVRLSLEQCLRDGIRAIDIDLTHVTFCDCSGLNAFLLAAQQTTAVGGTLRLHHPPPMLARMLDLIGPPAALVPVSPDGPVALVPVLSGDKP
ncbi:STAS domain-containing protein [Streptomyces sp. NBC_00280]|uniref:STAS domain-containing protein n=1 Tax=Streptomyces sp. NBC_00280 TaxID=2975699 RepID=UPI0032528CFF